MKTPNGMYREVYIWDDTVEWECFACRKKYHTGQLDHPLYCLYCGVKYTKQWTKRNPRLHHKHKNISYGYRITFEYMRTDGCRKVAHYIKPADSTWQVYTYTDNKWMFCNGYHKHIQIMKNHTFKNYGADRFRIVITRPDGTIKEIILKS